MKEALLGKLVMVLSRATPEELAATYRFATGEPLPDAKMNAEGRMQSAEYGSRPGGGPAYVFRWTGRDWQVVFDGGRPFYLEDTLGARYVNYLVHHPNVPISAFDLEVAIQPEKGEVRSKNSIQPESDAQALRQYRQELHRLQAEKVEAAGEPEEVARLEGEIEALLSALKEGVRAPDNGERARGNVRKAVAAVRAQLRKGGVEQKAFAVHLQRHLSLGHECLYSQPDVRIWG